MTSKISSLVDFSYQIFHTGPMGTFFASAMTTGAEIIGDIVEDDFDPRSLVPNRDDVSSSFISSIEWEPITRTIRVNFVRGPGINPAEYPGESYSKYASLRDAGSPGSYYWSTLRIGK